MPKICCRLDLAQEPVGADCRGDLRFQYLQRNLALVSKVGRKLYGGHAAFTKLPLDAIAPCERSVQTDDRVLHSTR